MKLVKRRERHAFVDKNMNKHYYLVTSLPYLKFGKEPDISSEEFLNECKKWVSWKEMELLNAAGAGFYEHQKSEMPCLKEWAEFDGELKSSLSKFRKAEQSGKPASVQGNIKGVVDQETPLLMELAIEGIRWDFLEHKSAGYQFDINWLVLYFLRLQIAERIEKFDKDEGEKVFYKLCEVDYEKTSR
ncbi:MAG: DUF2764 family protein [Candidatus Omnitrophota bacterium]